VPGYPAGRQKGGQPAAAPQKKDKQEQDQLHAAASRSGASRRAGRTGLFPASGIAYRTGAQALAPLLHGFGGAGHMFFP
jgi:hypothetical protein